MAAWCIGKKRTSFCSNVWSYGIVIAAPISVIVLGDNIDVGRSVTKHQNKKIS